MKMYFETERYQQILVLFCHKHILPTELLRELHTYLIDPNTPPPRPHRTLSNVKVVFIQRFPHVKDKWLAALRLCGGKIDNPVNNEHAYQMIATLSQAEKNELIECYIASRTIFEEHDRDVRAAAEVWDRTYPEAREEMKLHRRERRWDTMRRRDETRVHMFYTQHATQ